MSTRKTDAQVLIFTVLLCFVCGLILAVVAYGLREPQKEAKEFDQSKQMLIAARILTHDGYFQLENVHASYQNHLLVKNPEAAKATVEDIKSISIDRIRPLVTDGEGNVYSLEEKQITLSTYLAESQKSGPANLPLKLFYAILSNEEKSTQITAEAVAKDLKTIDAVVIPVSGFGLWAPIYGYIALGPDGNEVIGTTWYEMGETPGLGANIAAPWWQNQFYHKVIFHEQPDGKTEFQSAQIGIVVVKGKVKDVYGTSPKSKSAVDGISGATLTGDGVTAAYKNSLTPYRNFLIKLQEGKHESTSQTHAA